MDHALVNKTGDVLIFEPSAGGHQMHYVELIGRAVMTAGLGPVRLVTTKEALSHESTTAALSSGVFSLVETIDTAFDILPFRYRFRAQAKRQYRDTMGLARYIQAEGGHERFRIVFMPFLDSSSIIPLAAGRYPFGQIPFAGLVVRPSYHQHSVGILSRRRMKDVPERLVYKRILASPFLTGLFSIDPYFVQYHSDKRVVYTPDPAAFVGKPVPGVFRKRLGIAPDAVVILVYGHIDERKGLSQLIRAVARLDAKLRITILVCGRQKREVMKLLSEDEADRLRLGGQLVELNRYISPEEEHEAFLAANIVWVCYANGYANSSGAMIRAGQVGCPIIASRYGLTGKMVCDRHVGLSTDADDVSQIAHTIRRLSSDRTLRDSLGQNGLKLFSQHTPEAFVAPIVRLLQHKSLSKNLVGADH